MQVSANDYELIYLYLQKIDEAAEELVKRYNVVIKGKISKKLQNYRPLLSDKDELYQEGLIALLDAISSYQEDKNVPFYYFASLCIECSLRSCMKKYSTSSAYFFSSCISLDMAINETEGLYFYDVVEDKILQSALNFSEEGIYGKLILNDLKRNLSEFEYKIMMMRSQGYKYDEIAEVFHTTKKKVDNTIHRARMKMSDLKRKS